MKLSASNPISYPKFKRFGDAVRGVFIDFQEDVPSKFGREHLLTLQGEHAKLIVRTPTNLTRTLRQNLQDLPGKRLTITYTEDLPSKKGNPVKLFDVDVEEVQATATVASTGEANIVQTEEVGVPVQAAV